jgi:fatty acid-binding protein DegV
MAPIHIVTDSGARFTNPHTAQQFQISIVPNVLTLQGKTYRDGVDLSNEDAHKLIQQQGFAPQVTPPSVADYVAAYTRAAKSHSAIVSIHTSRELSQSWHNAQAAAQQLTGLCEIVVIDSRSICLAQGILVRATAKFLAEQQQVVQEMIEMSAIQGMSKPPTITAQLDEAVRYARGVIERLYAIYYVESIGFLMQNNILSPPHSILGTMMAIKPLLTLEGGRLQAIEKVRTRAQAVERLVDFMVEFGAVEEVVIAQHKHHLSEQARLLQDRLSLELPSRHFPSVLYSASLAALIGTDATGLIVFEGQN